MPIQSLNMPAFTGVAAGNTALCKLPIGNQYHDLQLIYSGVTLAQMKEIRLLLNGNVVQRYSGADRDVMNQFDGLQAAAGILQIMLDRQRLKNRVAEMETAINTGTADKKGRRITAFNIEIDIDAGAAAPAIQAHASVSDAMPGGPGTVMHVQRLPRSATGAGERQINDLPYGTETTAALNRSFIKSAQISKLEIKRGLVTIFKRDSSLNTFMNDEFGVRASQAGWYVVDPSERGYGGEPWDLIGYQDFNYICQFDAAEDVVFYNEYLGVLGS